MLALTFSPSWDYYEVAPQHDDVYVLEKVGQISEDYLLDMYEQFHLGFIGCHSLPVDEDPSEKL